MKKIISSLLICVLFVFILTGCSLNVTPTPTPDINATLPPMPTPEKMEFEETDDGWLYRVEDGHVVIYGYNGEELEVSIPSSIDGTAVTELNSVALCTEERVFAGDSKYHCYLTKVTIPSSITIIPDDLFSMCDNLVEVDVSKNSNFKVENNAIYNSDKTLLYYVLDKNSSSFTIPSSVKIIGGGAFRANTALTSITIPSTVETIGEYAFYDCPNLSSVTIEEGVVEIFNQAFTRCNSLNEITIPASIQGIPYQFVSFHNDFKIYVYRNSYAETFFNQEDVYDVYVDYIEYID